MNLLALNLSDPKARLMLRAHHIPLGVAKRAQMIAAIYKECIRQGIDPERAARIATGEEQVKVSDLLIPGSNPAKNVAKIETPASDIAREQNDVDRVYETEVKRRRYEGDFNNIPRKREI